MRTDYRRHPRRRVVVVGDVHGCYHTLLNLIEELGGHNGVPPEDVLLVSVGDLNNKGGVVGVNHPDGPKASGSVSVLRWALERHADGSLLVTDSNHGRRLGELLESGRRHNSDGGPLRGSVAVTLADIDAQPDAEQLVARLREFLLGLPPVLRLSGGPTGRLVVAHAAASERLLKQKSFTRREVMFHINAASFRWSGADTVVTGHVIVPTPCRERHRLPKGAWSGEVIRLEAGCYLGNGLAAYVADRDEIISVPTDRRDLRPAASSAAA